LKKRQVKSKARHSPSTGRAGKALKPFSDRALRERVFVKEYTSNGFRGREAAVAAGYAPDRARVTASELLSTERVQESVEIEVAKREKRLELTADDIVRKAWAIANADASELSRTERSCCRYCWGKGNRYQRTPKELQVYRQEFEDKTRAANKGKDPSEVAELLELFDAEGGIGWNPRLDPNPKCPECHGEGELRVVVADIRDLSPAARQLYAGVKQTEKGLEVKTRDQDGLLIQVGVHLGAFRRKVEVTGRNGGPIQQEHAMLSELIDAVDGAETGIALSREPAASLQRARR
jgi:hypothetical protein